MFYCDLQTKLNTDVFVQVIEIVGHSPLLLLLYTLGAILDQSTVAQHTHMCLKKSDCRVVLTCAMKTLYTQ